MKYDFKPGIRNDHLSLNSKISNLLQFYDLNEQIAMSVSQFWFCRSNSEQC